MDTAQLDDLKQFIDARISWSETGLEVRLGLKIGELRQEMHDGLVGVTEAIEAINDRDDKQDSVIKQLWVRVTGLKRPIA